MYSLVDSFVSQQSSRPKIIVVYGPTASGKTSMSIGIAKDLKSEVISADSRQIYRMMDIGTAKATTEEMQEVRHHMIDIRDPNQSYSVAEWVQESQTIIHHLHDQGLIPIVCGGTGLYIDALIYQFAIPAVPANTRIRTELEAFRQEHSNEALWRKLADLDPQYAQDLHPNNYPYVIRGIEVFQTTGKSKQSLKLQEDPKYNVLLLSPFEDISREEVYERINRRVMTMFGDGLVEEVEGILMKYELGTMNDERGTMNDEVSCLLEKLPGLHAIGYKEVLQYMKGEMNLDRCKELIAQHSRNYAKRQETWFRKYTNTHGEQ